MILSLSSQDHEQLLLWAKEIHPEECCGLIWANKCDLWTVENIEKAQNISDDPMRFFEIDPKTLFNASRKSRHSEDKLIGYFHSHPNGLMRPSKHDAKCAISLDMVWLIVTQYEVSAWYCIENGELHNKFNPVTIKII